MAYTPRGGSMVQSGGDSKTIGAQERSQLTAMIGEIADARNKAKALASSIAKTGSRRAGYYERASAALNTAFELLDKARSSNGY